VRNPNSAEYRVLEFNLVIRVGLLRWPRHIFRMQEQKSCIKLTLRKPERTRRVGRPAVRWLDSVEEDFKTMGFGNWRRKAQDQDQWRQIVKEAKVYHGL
jgi:hypothetical protein